MIARTLPEASWPDGTIPILYLPGVSRHELRAVESCPAHLQPLAELQYRGVLWSQVNGRDWTILAFLKSQEGGLGLDVAQDARTVEAMQRALVQLADTPVASLRGRRLEASDFDQLLTTDPVRDLLRWLNDPAATRKQWGAEVWGAFRSVCKAEFGFDPESDGELVGAERLGRRVGKWAQVWSRFEESPRLYAALPDLLRRAQPHLDLADDRSPWPAENDRLEAELREGLKRLGDRSPTQAAEALKRLEGTHGARRGWVWAELGEAPLARALDALSSLAETARKPIGGTSVEEIGGQYGEWGWRVDAAALEALGWVERGQDVEAVSVTLRAVYLPWLQEGAERLQAIVAKGTWPVGTAIQTEPEACILFADGLRLDVGQRLRGALEARGLRVAFATRWVSLPSVTATCKPDVSPVAGSVAGAGTDADFAPHVAADGKPLGAQAFRKLLAGAGVQVLEGSDTGDPAGSAWTEHGDLDRRGHDEGAKLARRIREELRELVERIEALLAVGWKSVRVVTDHGWLLMPDGLPKANLPGYLAETRWGRCAVLKIGANPSGLVVSWRWSSEVSVALAPGVCCYRAGMDYAHGGLSLQECLTPVLTVTAGQRPAGEGRIAHVEWRRLRCRVLVEGAAAGSRVDIRTKVAEPKSSVAGKGKIVDEEGRASLVVENPDLAGTAAVVVLLNANDGVVAKLPTTIGGGD
jgi:hypothetical protein